MIATLPTLPPLDLPSWQSMVGVATALALVLMWAVVARRRRQGATYQRPRPVLTHHEELIVPAHDVLEWARPALEEIRRRAVHEAWMKRRAAETPWFAQLAQEMGLGLALGVAA